MGEGPNRSYEEIYGRSAHMSQDNAANEFAYPQNGTQPQPTAPMGMQGLNPNGQGGSVKPAKQGHGWIVGIVVAICASLVLLFAFASCSSAVGSIFSFSDPGIADSEPTEPVIGVISLDGTIQYDGTECSPEGLRTLLEKAEKMQNIKGVILKVNSGGGIATAGEEMSELVYDFEKPIIVMSESSNASAAYEISSQADYIFVNKTTSIGSIGTYMQITDLSGLYGMLGINIESITSSNSKDSTSGNRPLTEEERQWYQKMVDQITDTFIEYVSRGRDMTADEVRALANGLPYTGIDAVGNGLADEIGYMDDAIAYLSDELGYKGNMETYELRLSSADISSILNLLSEDRSSIQDVSIDKLKEAIKAENVAQ